MMKKKILQVMLVLLLCVFATVPSFAQNFSDESSDHRLYPRVVDNGNLLTDKEESELLSIVDSYSEKQQVDIVIVTTNSLDGKTPREYADDFYDYNGYGYGEQSDGILLLVSMENRDWYISTCGFGIEAITDRGIDEIADEFLPYLSDGEYAKAFDVFADECYDYIVQAKSGEPYYAGEYYEDDYYYGNETSIFDGISKGVVIVGSLIFAALAGFLGAFIPVGVMKSKMKSVRSQPAASSYVVSGSHIVTESRDQFLYHTVTKTAIPKDTSSGGGRSGGGVHRSSFGGMHGGRGGKF